MIEILKVIAMLCASAQYPAMQYTCEKMTLAYLTY